MIRRSGGHPCLPYSRGFQPGGNDMAKSRTRYPPRRLFRAARCRPLRRAGCLPLHFNGAGSANSSIRSRDEPQSRAVRPACPFHNVEIEKKAGGSRCPTLAVSMQSEVTLALTLTLSPRRGNLQWVRREKSLNGEPSPALEKVLPLPAGEGRGEGEHAFQLNSSGLEVRDWPLE